MQALLTYWLEASLTLSAPSNATQQRSVTNAAQATQIPNAARVVSNAANFPRTNAPPTQRKSSNASVFTAHICNVSVCTCKPLQALQSSIIQLLEPGSRTQKTWSFVATQRCNGSNAAIQKKQRRVTNASHAALLGAIRP